MTNILLLGGTSTAQALATLLMQAGIRATYSHAGVTKTPKQPALPTRVGGFGGVSGLRQYLIEHHITHVVDATHPFAAQMSRNAIAACDSAGIPMLSLERNAWRPITGDQWIDVPDMQAAAQALPDIPCRVFLAIGRKQLAPFALHGQHEYLLRVIDSADDLPLTSHTCVIARGPFELDREIDLLRQHRIQYVVSKNAGGSDTYAKIEAARCLEIPVVMVRRPVVSERPHCETPAEALNWVLRTPGALS